MSTRLAAAVMLTQIAFGASPLLSPLPSRPGVPTLLRLKASVFGGRPVRLKPSTNTCVGGICTSSSRAHPTAKFPASASLVDTGKTAVPCSSSSDVNLGKCGTNVLTFQDAILRLQEYWASRGCVLWHPYNTEVGAGTMNPATFLRVLGPEPWSVAYEEPSIRPDDSRYGENPNRLQCHTQFQVIVKPAPECPQELVVGSYRALGIDVTKRDIRFVEDNWESPALGAWGLGWEVWLDGMEITQFTYFQQAGSVGLDPVSVEITYGLERIIMALQGKTHFKNIVYAPGITYGEILSQNEVEMSRYNLDEANIARNRTWFDEYEAEALQLLEKRLPVPAFNYLLKASHTFNILDSRGAVGVTERARFFQRMRVLSREVAQLWVERRQEIGHPMLSSSTMKDNKLPQKQKVSNSAISFEEQVSALVSLHDHADFVLELGVEELPANDVSTAVRQIKHLLRELLERERLSYSSIEVDATPRRLAARVSGLQTRQADSSRRVRGPPIRAAVASDGKLTKAALGFMKSQNVTDQERLDFDEDAGYVYANVDIPGRSAAYALAESIPQAILAKVSFDKTMRWNSSGVYFSRPIRWILCLLHDTLIPFDYAGVSSSRVTRSLRGADGFARDISVHSAADYSSTLESIDVIISQSERASLIKRKAAELAASIGGHIPIDNTESNLVDELTDLVENPIPLLGRFDEEFLALPMDVLITVMRKHQRYLPILDENGKLMNAFITVANGSTDLIDLMAVRTGNEAVLRARYSDAAFFYAKDIKDKKLSDFVPALDGLIFQEKLGSMLDKVRRVEKATPTISKLIGLSNDEADQAQDVARLYKADLGTSMVVEMTSLAGVMGRHYARRSGEVSTIIADAIFDAALPRYSGDQLPQSRIGCAVGISDRIESLSSLFSVGVVPRATADPFALRRTALGLIQILVSRSISLDIRDAVRAVSPDANVSNLVCDFVGKRLEGYLDESGFRPDVIKAVLAITGNRCNPRLAFEVATSLQKMLESSDDKPVVTDAYEAYGRAYRLIKSVSGLDEADIVSGESSRLDLRVDENLFESDVERRLLERVLHAEDAIAKDPSVTCRLNAVSSIKIDVDSFCDGVFVSADDKAIRNNRIALLQRMVRMVAPALNLALLQF